MKAFRYAVSEALADVLEMDVRVTRDGKFVVWHGPGLGNVYIKGEPSDLSIRPPWRNQIEGYSWSELDNRAWVRDPDDDGYLENVPQVDERRLVRLEEVLVAFPNIPMNVELKGSVRPEDIREFARILTEDRRAHPTRTIVVASLSKKNLVRFQEMTSDRFPTNIPAFPLFRLWRMYRFDLGPIEGLMERAAELPYCNFASEKGFIERIRAAGGTSYVFLTRFPLLCPALDAQEPATPRENDKFEDAIFNILDRGVDGIMTDRPKRVREVMANWAASHRFP